MGCPSIRGEAPRNRQQETLSVSQGDTARAPASAHRRRNVFLGPRRQGAVRAGECAARRERIDRLGGRVRARLPAALFLESRVPPLCWHRAECVSARPLTTTLIRASPQDTLETLALNTSYRTAHSCSHGAFMVQMKPTLLSRRQQRSTAVLAPVTS